jgi:hypothetical protein
MNTSKLAGLVLIIIAFAAGHYFGGGSDTPPLMTSSSGGVSYQGGSTADADGALELLRSGASKAVAGPPMHDHSGTTGYLQRNSLYRQGWYPSNRRHQRRQARRIGRQAKTQ